jgi:hypothetical protein
VSRVLRRNLKATTVCSERMRSSAARRRGCLRDDSGGYIRFGGAFSTSYRWVSAFPPLQHGDHPHEGDGSLANPDRERIGVQCRHHRHGTPALSAERSVRIDSSKAHWSGGAGDARTSGGFAKACRDTTASAGRQLQCLVAGSVERAPAPSDRYRLQRRSTWTDHEARGFLVSASQAHDERHTRRRRIPDGCTEAARDQKKRSAITLTSR